MYKNLTLFLAFGITVNVSILVLMDLCIKTRGDFEYRGDNLASFNPCFNGSMYKNSIYISRNMERKEFQSLF